MNDIRITRLKKLFELSLTLSGDPIEIFQHAAKMIGELMEVKIVCLSEIQGEQLHFLAVYLNGEIYTDAGSCNISITPCATVEYSKDIRIYDHVKLIFPEASFLQEHNAFAYCGFPSLDNQGKVVAVTCLLDDKPHDFSIEDQEVLRIIGQRIGMEIERKSILTEKERVRSLLKMNEDRLQQAVCISQIGIFDRNHENNLIYCSPELRLHYGWSPNEPVTPDKFTDCIYHEDREKVIATMQNAHNPAGNGMLDLEYRIFCRDGEIRWLAAKSQTHFYTDGKVSRAVRTVGAIRNITEKKGREQELRIFATAFQTQEGIIITDLNQIIIRVNEAFTKITGYSAQEAIGNKPSLLKSGLHDSLFYREMHMQLFKTGYWQGEIWDRHKKGHIYPKWLTITAVKDESGKTTHFIGNFADITERKESEKQIVHLAYYDPLTQLPNRTLLRDHLENAIASHRCFQKFTALLFLDLDNFKIINDTKGHEMGDKLLVQVGRRLKNCLNEKDTVSRFGGDEFVILLENLNKDINEATLYVTDFAEKIIGSLNEPYHIGDFVHTISVSIGIILFNSPSLTESWLLASSDAAMYQAKKSGKNTYRFFDPIMQQALEQRSILETELRNAVFNDHLRLVYQPQVDLQGQITGVEALIRWHHPERGIITPLQFIPLAEEIGLILNIGYWVLETACKQLNTWKDKLETCKLSMSVNVSPKQFYQTNFVAEIRNLIQQYAIEPNQLKLEITENIVLNDLDLAIEKMHALKSSGIVLSMDDFGTGYSSLSYLKQLPFDQIKIDKSFVKEVNTSANDTFMIETVINIGQQFGMEVIAEGVEDTEQWNLLKHLGCKQFQGYLFYRPIPVSELNQILYNL